jgi:hypothetical protein
VIKQYRKKPVVIEAVKFEYSEAGIKQLQDFCGKNLVKWGKDRCITAVGWAHIGTLEDGDDNSVQVEHVATEGDYIIKGVSGEFYPCKPDIFEQTYESI